MDLGLASANLAELPRERILNFMAVDELLEWTGERTGARSW
jgi:hypothetical protein